MSQSNSSPTKPHPAQAIDDEPDFDLAPDLGKIKESLTWQKAIGRVALIGLSRQLHQLLHQFDPTKIGPTTGPFRHPKVVDVISSYVVRHRQLLMDPAARGMCQAHRIPEFRLIMGRDQFLFSEMASLIRKHMVLLDIVD